MSVTVLAIGFLVLLLLLTFFGYRMISRKSREQTDTAGSERCSVCLGRSAREALVERQIGDYKILYFCHDCIAALHADAKALARANGAGEN
jgi:hypothetical protein